MRIRFIFAVLLIITVMLSVIPTTKAQEGVQAIVAYDNVNVRAAPDPNAPLLGQLRFESTVTAHSREDLPDNGGIWVYVSGDGLEGWVLSTYLSFPSGVFAENLVVTNDLVVETDLAPSANTDGSINAYVFSPDTESGQLNVRLNPGTWSYTIGRLRGGTGVTAHFRTVSPKDGDIWIYITSQHMAGWVHSDYLSFPYGLNVEQLPVSDIADPSLAFPPVTEANIQATVNETELDVYTEPGIHAPIAGQLVAGTNVTVAYREDFTRQPTWVYITAPDGLHGWVAVEHLDFPANISIENLPVGYGPDIPSGIVVAQVRTYSDPDLYSGLYQNPVQDAVRIGDLPQGALVIVHGEEDAWRTGQWVYVTWVHGNLTGWLGRDSLNYPPGVSAYSVNWARGQSENPQISNASVLDQPRGLHHRYQRYRPAALFPEPIPSQGYIVLPCNCYTVRAVPDRSAPTIFLYYTHRPRYMDAFVVYGRTEDGEWLYVSYPNDPSLSGWITDRWEFRNVRGFNRMDVPIIPAIANPPLPPARPALESVPATMVRPLIVDSQTLPAGSAVTVVGRDLFSWSFKVVVNGHEGWLRRDELTIQGDYTLLPVLSHSGLGNYWS